MTEDERRHFVIGILIMVFVTILVLGIGYTVFEGFSQ
jgi:hypothetical protein